MEHMVYATYDRNCNFEWRHYNNIVIRNSATSLCELYIAFMSSSPDLIITLQGIISYDYGDSYKILKWNTCTEGTFIDSSTFRKMLNADYSTIVNQYTPNLNPKKHQFLKFINNSTVHVVINKRTNKIEKYFGQVNIFTVEPVKVCM